MSGSRAKSLRKCVFEDMNRKGVHIKFFKRIYRTAKKLYTCGAIDGNR